MKPKKHRFHYRIFLFYIDLDELDLLNKKLFLFSRNRFNFFSFRDAEHLQLPLDRPDKAKPTKEHITDYLRQNGFQFNGQRIMLLTNLNVLGYNFNPVSFYFVIDRNNKPCCAVAEVSNTFREMKLYFMGPECLDDKGFRLNTAKYFYVSPFIDHDAHFDFNLTPPDQKLNLRIDDHKGDERFFISTLTGSRRRLSNAALVWYSIRFPLITLRTMGLIHWNALLLWLKKIPYAKKNEKMHLQKDVLRKYEHKQ
jgi:DUF1365 family protein